MVPYDKKEKQGNKWVVIAKEAQFQIGYKGYIQLAIRSGQYRKIVVSEIKAGECICNPITEEIELHPIMDPAKREKEQTVGYYTMFELMNGFRKELYSPREAVEAHARKYSQAYRIDLNKGYQNSKWTTDFDAMAKKTLIRQLIGKWGIMSVEMQQAYEKDMAVIDEDGTARYIDNANTIDVEAQVAEDMPRTQTLFHFWKQIRRRLKQRRSRQNSRLLRRPPRKYLVKLWKMMKSRIL